MAVTARKYNPGFLSVDELVATFCVRTAEYESLIEALRECSGSANTHQIVIGPRGSGKTSLLLRVAAEVMRDTDLSARFFPIVFAEESYEVSTAGEFWLECVSRLADQAPRRDDGVDLHRTFEELRTIHDDRMLEDRCLGVLQDFADREEKRLVLIVENLNMMFRDMGDDDAGWRLRKALQTEPRIVLLASATSRFDQMNDPKGSALRAVPGDPVASARHGRLRDLVAHRVGAGAGAADDPGAANSDWRQPAAADHCGPVRREFVVSRADGRPSRPGRRPYRVLQEPPRCAPGAGAKGVSRPCRSLETSERARDRGPGEARDQQVQRPACPSGRQGGSRGERRQGSSAPRVTRSSTSTPI